MTAQEMFVDNVMNDIIDILTIDDGHVYAVKIKAKLEERIQGYDSERKEQLERDLPTAIARAMADVC